MINYIYFGMIKIIRTKVITFEYLCIKSVKISFKNWGGRTWTDDTDRNENNISYILLHKQWTYRIMLK